MGWRGTFSILKPVPAPLARAWIDEACASLPLHKPLIGDPAALRHVEQASYVAVHHADTLTISDDAWQLAAEIAALHTLLHLELRAQEGDHWDFTLYRDSTIVADFSTRVGYWHEDRNDPPRPFKQGTRGAFLAAWGGDAARLRPYLIDWDSLIIRKHRKSNPQDQHTTNDVYQVLDFIRELGAAAPHGHPNRFEFIAPRWVS
jgi:hypothetical protein